VRSAARVPRNQTRLAGSTPTRTGRPWKKISIETADQDQGAALGIEDLQHLPGAAPGRLDDPVQSRAAGAGRGAQDDGQEPADLVEAQAHRGGGDSELWPSALGEVDGLLQPRPELRILVAEGLELVEELPPRGSAGMLGFDGGVDLLGMVVGGLTTTAGSLGLGGDGAVGSAQAGGRIGDPRRQGYLEHGGWAVLGACR
jgi:hypothetical protein